MNVYWDGYKSTSSLVTNQLKLGTNPLNFGEKQSKVQNHLMPSSMSRVFNIKCLLSSFIEWVILTTSHLTLWLFLIWVWDKSKALLPWSSVKNHSSLFTLCFLLFICSLNNFLSFLKLVSYFPHLPSVWSWFDLLLSLIVVFISACLLAVFVWLFLFFFRVLL